MLGVDAPGLELVGGLSLELWARLRPCVWQTTAAVASWLWMLPLEPLVVCRVWGELAVAALLRLLVLLYLVPPRARPPLGVSTSMLSDAAMRKSFISR